jgi:UPF0755 protein
MDENQKITTNAKTKWIAIAVAAVVIAIIVIVVYMSMFSAPQKNAEPERFIVALGSNKTKIIKQLQTDGFIKSPWAFNFALNWKGEKDIKAGGYKISKSMDTWEIAVVLSGKPYMKWVVIPEGLRKEEIADIIALALGWNNEQKQEWITKDTAAKYDYIEGVYFPDTYLIPVDESPSDVAERLRLKFEEQFAPYAQEALKQNIKWDTLLKISSIVQREAAGKDDMPLVAGILWNRLLAGMKLEVDATVQYARGKTSGGWWSPIKPADKRIDSLYNTYKYKGLPPHPIDNPGIEAIKAALYPAKTECLYYLHDSSGIIHCAKTYEEHQQNIEKYLH